MSLEREVVLISYLGKAKGFYVLNVTKWDITKKTVLRYMA